MNSIAIGARKADKRLFDVILVQSQPSTSATFNNFPSRPLEDSGDGGKTIDDGGPKLLARCVYADVEDPRKLNQLGFELESRYFWNDDDEEQKIDKSLMQSQR